MSLADVTECPRCTTATTYAVTTRQGTQLCRCRICQATFHATVDSTGHFTGNNVLSSQPIMEPSAPPSGAGNRE